MTDSNRISRTAVLLTVSAVSVLQAATITVINVALPQLQGSFSATPDQITWVVTLNVLGAAIATPALGWTVSRFGWRRATIWSVVAFGVLSFLCAIAQSLPALLGYRFGQGVFGALFTPVGQLVLLSIYTTPAERAWSQSMYGVVAVVGQAMAPAIGGYIAEAYNWRFIFIFMVPCTVVSWVMCVVFLHDGGRGERVRLDWSGYIALAAAIACLQLMLDRGERLAWFESAEITLYAIGAGLSLYLFIVHSLTTANPFMRLQLFRDRNFTLGLILIVAFGMMNFTPMVLMPTLLQHLVGYPDSLIGLILAWRGVGLLVGFIVVAYLGRLDPRVGLVIGFGAAGWSGMQTALFDLNVTFAEVAWVTALQGFGTGFIWVPATIITFSSLASRDFANATALFHLVRHMGTSVSISVAVMVVAHTGAISYSELSASVDPLSEALLIPSVIGSWDVTSAVGLTQLSAEIDRQSQMIGYLNAFTLYAVVNFLAIPLVLLVKIKQRLH